MLRLEYSPSQACGAISCAHGLAICHRCRLPRSSLSDHAQHVRSVGRFEHCRSSIVPNGSAIFVGAYMRVRTRTPLRSDDLQQARVAVRPMYSIKPTLFDDRLFIERQLSARIVHIESACSDMIAYWARPRPTNCRWSVHRSVCYMRSEQTRPFAKDGRQLLTMTTDTCQVQKPVAIKDAPLQVAAGIYQSSELTAPRRRTPPWPRAWLRSPLRRRTTLCGPTSL